MEDVMSKVMIEIEKQQQNTWNRRPWSYTTGFGRAQEARRQAELRVAQERLSRSPQGIAQELRRSFVRIADRFIAVDASHAHLSFLSMLGTGSLPDDERELVVWVETYGPVAQAAQAQIERIENEERARVREAEQAARAERVKAEQERADLRKETNDLYSRLSRLLARGHSVRHFEDDPLECPLDSACMRLLDARPYGSDVEESRAWIERVRAIIGEAEAQKAKAEQSWAREREQARKAGLAGAARIRETIAGGLGELEVEDLERLWENALDLKIDRYLREQDIVPIEEALREAKALAREIGRRSRKIEELVDAVEQAFDREHDIERYVRRGKVQEGRAGHRAPHGHRHGHDPDFRRAWRRQFHNC